MYMNKTIQKFSLVFLFLLLFALMAGCASTPPSSNVTTPSATGTNVPGSGPAFVAGDIVKIPTSTASTAWLIISYDAATDMYERALIYPNADGSWGYRLNSNTARSPRTIMDRDYTKIINKAVSAIPILTPTITATTQTLTPTVTTVTVTSTTVPTGRPTIKNIIPDEGNAGTAIAITELSGTNFQSGATVALVKSGSPNITATNINVQSPTLITCTLSPPSDAVAGSWDVVVTNPDGQYGVYTNLFSIHNTANPTATTTSTGGITITSIDPAFVVASNTYIPITVSGSNFQNGIIARLTKSGSGDIVATTVSRTDTTLMRCFFNIPKTSQGTWNLVLTNTDGTTGTLENAFDVRS